MWYERLHCSFLGACALSSRLEGTQRGLCCEQMLVGAWRGLLKETDLPAFESWGQATALTGGSCVSNFQLMIVDSEELLKGGFVPAG